MPLYGVTSFSHLKDVTNTCKRMWHSPTIAGISSVHWLKFGRSWRLQMCFHRLLCVRIEIAQLYCVNCWVWVIIHFLSVSCTKINHSHYVLVIWSSLQLTSKQWIITQKFTVRAYLFLKQTFHVFHHFVCIFMLYIMSALNVLMLNVSACYEHRCNCFMLIEYIHLQCKTNHDYSNAMQSYTTQYTINYNIYIYDG